MRDASSLTRGLSGSVSEVTVQSYECYWGLKGWYILYIYLHGFLQYFLALLDVVVSQKHSLVHHTIPFTKHNSIQVIQVIRVISGRVIRVVRVVPRILVRLDTCSLAFSADSGSAESPAFFSSARISFFTLFKAFS